MNLIRLAGALAWTIPVVALASFATANQGVIQLATVGCVAVGVILLVTKSARVHIALASALYMSAHMNLIASESAAIVVRLAGLAVLLIAAVRFRKASSQNLQRGYGVLVGVAIAGGSAYLWTIVGHGMDLSALLAGSTFLAVASSLILLARSARRSECAGGMATTLTAFLLASLVLGIAIPSLGLEANRLEGVFKNANTLGFFSGVGVLLAICLKRGPVKYVLMISAWPCLLWSASRSALLALAMALLAGALRSLFLRGSKSAIVISVIAGIAALAGWRLAAASGLLIFRSNDSRLNGNQYAEQVIGLHFWQGIGYGRSLVEVASTPLRWFVEGGVIACLAVLLAYGITMAMAWRVSVHTFSTATFAVISSLFEGWYFAGGSALFAIFWLTYIASLAESKDDLYRRAPNTSADSGLQRPGAVGVRFRGPLPSA